MSFIIRENISNGFSSSKEFSCFASIKKWQLPKLLDNESGIFRSLTNARGRDNDNDKTERRRNVETKERNVRRKQVAVAARTRRKATLG